MNKPADFRDKIPSFELLLNSVDVESISNEPYCRKYLQHLLLHRKYFLEIYADVLEKLVAGAGKPAAEIELIDFGCGNGVLGIFAKYCGFKKLYLNDINEKFILAAQKLAAQLHISIDAFLTGDVHNLQRFFTGRQPDAIAGTDVIEHIYNLEDFFETLRSINPFFISVFTTASNPENFIKVRQLKRLQVKDEYEGGKPEDHTLFGEISLEPFFETRKKILSSHLENIGEEKLTALAKATRGMNKRDILTVIEEYIDSGIIPAAPTHPSNTCDPITGSWTERILPISAYADLYFANGFTLKIDNGFYDEHKKGLKKLANQLLNRVISIFGIYVAPYIVLSGSKK